MKCSRPIVVAGLAVALFIVSLPAAEQTCEDDFTLSGSRTANAPLDGTTTEYGALEWNADSSVIVTDSGTITTTANSGTASAWVALASPPSTVRLYAEIDPRNCDWTALAFGKTWDGTFNSQSQLWIYLRSSGNYAIHANGTAITLGTGTFTGSGLHAVELIYDATHNTATVLIDGASKINRVSLGSFTPAITTGGIRINGLNTATAKPLVGYFGVHRAAEDTFTLTASRLAGDSVQGLTVETGNQSWNAYNSAVLGSGGQLTTASTSSSSAWLPIPNPPQGIHVSADLDPQGSDWSALGLGRKWDSNFYTTAQLWVLLKPTGTYQIYADGTRLLLKSGTAPGFSLGTPSAIELLYDKAANAFTVAINDTVVLDACPLNDVLFTPQFDSVGIRFNGPIDATTKPAADNLLILTSHSTDTAFTAEMNNPIAFYAPGTRLSLELTARDLAQSSVKVSTQLIDFSGTTVSSVSNSTYPVNEGVLHAIPTFPSTLANGYYELSVQVNDPSNVPLYSFEQSFAIVPAVDETWRTGSGNPFGAMVFPHISYPMADREHDARIMKRLGMRYVRTHRENWIWGQASPGAAFNWDLMDEEVGIYDDYGLRLIATVGWPTPTWASEADGFPGTNSPSNFKPKAEYLPDALDFYEAMATRYGDSIAYYEIGNEVDAYFWKGSLANFKKSNTAGILLDYYNYFTSLAAAIRTGDPDAKIAPSTTRHAPEGYLYTPWLSTLLTDGLGSQMNAFSTHYATDLDALTAALPTNLQTAPIIFTEIGGFWRGTVTGDLAFSDAMKSIIKDDYRQNVVQLTHANVKATCKFLLREQDTYGGEGSLVSGLLDNDFGIRPSAVAYATLVRTLAGATFIDELNITDDASATGAWLEGYAFNDRDGQRVNVLFLNGADSSTVTLVPPRPRSRKWMSWDAKARSR